MTTSMTTTTDRHLARFHEVFERLLDDGLLTPSQVAAAVGYPAGVTGPVSKVRNQHREPGIGWLIALIANCPSDEARAILLAVFGPAAGQVSGAHAAASLTIESTIDNLLEADRVLANVMRAMRRHDDGRQSQAAFVRDATTAILDLQSIIVMLEGVSYRLFAAVKDQPLRRPANRDGARAG